MIAKNFVPASYAKRLLDDANRLLDDANRIKELCTMLDASAINDPALNSPPAGADAEPTPFRFPIQHMVPINFRPQYAAEGAPPPRIPTPVVRVPTPAPRPFWLKLTNLNELPVQVRSHDVVGMEECFDDTDADDEIEFTRVTLVSRGHQWEVDVEETVEEIRNQMEGK